jgi:hypothetical protein
MSKEFEIFHKSSPTAIAMATMTFQYDRYFILIFYRHGCFDLPIRRWVGHGNIRSYIKCGNKLDEIKSLLIQNLPSMFYHSPKLGLTTLESWSDDMLFIPNYTFVRHDRSANTSGEGIITYIHNDIPYVERENLISTYVYNQRTLKSNCAAMYHPF